jgi:hypothetical protein
MVRTFFTLLLSKEPGRNHAQSNLRLSLVKEDRTKEFTSMRRFQFEADIYETLNCVPMAVRRKLDRVGLKVGLDQWQSLSRAERLAICYMPAFSHDEREALRAVLVAAAMARFGCVPKELPVAAREEADPPSSVPLLLAARSKDAGYDLEDEVWRSLDEDERYALLKLGNGKMVSHNLPKALAEFLSRPPQA